MGLKAMPKEQIPQESLPGSMAAMLMGDISAILNGTQKAHTRSKHRELPSVVKFITIHGYSTPTYVCL